MCVLVVFFFLKISLPFFYKIFYKNDVVTNISEVVSTQLSPLPLNRGRYFSLCEHCSNYTAALLVQLS